MMFVEWYLFLKYIVNIFYLNFKCLSYLYFKRVKVEYKV